MQVSINSSASSPTGSVPKGLAILLRCIAMLIFYAIWSRQASSTQIIRKILFGFADTEAALAQLVLFYLEELGAQRC